MRRPPSSRPLPAGVFPLIFLALLSLPKQNSYYFREFEEEEEEEERAPPPPHGCCLIALPGPLPLQRSIVVAFHSRPEKKLVPLTLSSSFYVSFSMSSQ